MDSLRHHRHKKRKEKPDIKMFYWLLVASGFIKMLNILDWRVLYSLSLLFVNTQLQNIGPSVNTKLDSMVFLRRKIEKHCYRLLKKKACLLSICIENTMAFYPSQIMKATSAITSAQKRTCTRNIYIYFNVGSVQITRIQTGVSHPLRRD